MLPTLVFAVLAFLVCWLALLALDFVFQVTASHGSDVINKSVTVTADDKAYAEVAVGASATVTYTGCAGLPANVKGICVCSDQALTLNINYSSGADDTFTLVANEPLFWHNKLVGLSDPFVNTDAIVSFDLTNLTTTAATVKIFIARDGTP